MSIDEDQNQQDAARRVWNERTDLRLMGARADRYQILPKLAHDWLQELLYLGMPLGGRKETEAGSFPPVASQSGVERRVRLDNGYSLTLRLGVGLEDPRRDGRSFWTTQVEDATPRDDRAMLAMLAAAEGTELRKNPSLRHKDLDRLRSEENLSDAEQRMLAFANLLLLWHRPDLELTDDKRTEILIETADRVAKVTEAVRQLSDFLEFGEPGSNTRRPIEDAQSSIYAAELRHFADFAWPEVAEKLGLDTTAARRRSSAMTAQQRAERGVKLYIQAFGDEENWDRYKTRQLGLYKTRPG